MRASLFKKSSLPRKTPLGAPAAAAATAKKGPGGLPTPSAVPADASAHSPATSTAASHDDELPSAPPVYVKPPNQLQLSEAELKEDVSRVLTATDPKVPDHLVTYSYKERAYKPDPPGQTDVLAMHFAVEGGMLHKDSVEAKQQARWEEKRKDELEQTKHLALAEAVQAGEEAFFVGDEGKKAMRGGFQYCERAAQTSNRPMKDKGVGTEPPPVFTFSATCNQWEIYDAYLEHYRELQRTSSGKAATAAGDAPAQDRHAHDAVHSKKMAKSLQVLERMLNQNAEDEVFHDFKYWNDASDAHRSQGSLLPLWQFMTERTKRKQVTALGWNLRYHDLFAVGYGSYEFLRQGTGLICCFSLKNTTTPQYTFSTEAGVMCLDFHPEHPFLIAAGCYDGTVLVFDVRKKATRPIYASTVTTGKHTDPVWSVRWQTLEEEFGGGGTGGSGAGGAGNTARELCFYSVSSDGHVAAWLLSKTELKMEPVMQLKLVPNAGVASIVSSSTPGDSSSSSSSNSNSSSATTTDGDAANLLASLTGMASGSWFDFNPLSGQGHLFLVGTEEGTLHKCSKAYSGQYLETYEGHHLAVHAVRWNPFHPRLFLSCSADWTVKLWDHTRPAAPLLSFDLGNSVSDVDWSPVSSTTFAAVTSDGRAHVFDLAANKHDPLCVQKVVKRAKLTHVAFNGHDPVLLVGDDRGEVTSLKLSPNLRNLHEPKDEAGNLLPHDASRLQYNHVERLLAAVLGGGNEKGN